MDYGEVCNRGDMKGEIFVAKGENLHMRLDQMSGRLHSALIFDDGAKPSIKEWFNVDNRPGLNVPEDRRNHAIPRSSRKPDRILLTGLVYRRVQMHQPPLNWLQKWLFFTKNVREDAVTWEENFSIFCNSVPYFDTPDWKLGFELTLTLYWNQESSKARFLPIGEWL